MSLGPSYTKFSDLLRDLGSNLRGWGRTQECDRILQNMAAQIAVGSPESQVDRIASFARYALFKREVGYDYFTEMPADVRAFAMGYTLQNALYALPVERGLSQAGRFSRAVKETQATLYTQAGFATNGDKRAAYLIWLNNMIVALMEGSEQTAAPFVADSSFYQINNEVPWVLNDGSDINISVGDRVEFVTFGIGFNASQWTQDGADVGLPGEERHIIASAVVDDTGEYINTYSNDTGSTASPSFNLVVT